MMEEERRKSKLIKYPNYADHTKLSKDIKNFEYHCISDMRVKSKCEKNQANIII